MTGRAFEDSKTRHGTYSGWSLHKRRGQDPCPACYAAKAGYDRRYNAQPEKMAAARLLSKAQNLARSRLTHRHPDEYRLLYEQAKAELAASDSPRGAL